MKRRISLLLVDDETALLVVLARWFRRKGYDVTAVTSPSAAENSLCRTSIDVALVDLGFPGGGGRELVEYLCNLSTRPCIVVLSGRADPKYISGIIESGADDYLVKPSTLTRIEEVVEDVVAARAQTSVTQFDQFMASRTTPLSEFHIRRRAAIERQ